MVSPSAEMPPFARVGTEVASSGTILLSGERPTSVSVVSCAKSTSVCAVTNKGLSERGSLTMPMRISWGAAREGPVHAHSATATVKTAAVKRRLQCTLERERNDIAGLAIARVPCLAVVCEAARAEVDGSEHRHLTVEIQR